MSRALFVQAVVRIALATPASFGASSALAAPPTGSEPIPVFDEAAAKLSYLRWLLAWKLVCHDSDGEISLPGPFDSRCREHADALPSLPSWPINPDQGLLVNDLPKAPKKLIWAHQDESALADPGMAVEAYLWASITLGDWDFPDAIDPVLCVPEACYFTSPIVSPRKNGKPIGTPVLKKPGVWIALRPHVFEHGRCTPDCTPLALAGILIHRTAPKKPLEDPLFLAWRARLAERFPLDRPPLSPTP